MTRAISLVGSHQIADQIVDGPNCVSPGVGHFADRSALRNPTFFADNPTDALQFARHALVRLDHRIECVGDLARHAAQSSGSRAEKSPRLNAINAASS